MVHLAFLRAFCEARRSADTACGVLRHVELKDLEPCEPCAICHEDMGTSETSDGTSDGSKASGSGEVGQLPCNHCFHKACLRQWLVLKRRCPLCNQTVPTHTGKWQSLIAHGIIWHHGYSWNLDSAESSYRD